MNRLVRQLKDARTAERLALVGFLPSGYPSAADFAAALEAASAAGADAMEIALPNPPLPLDGPLIQQAVAQGAVAIPRPADSLQIASTARAGNDMAIIALAYRHACDELGTDGLIDLCRTTGVDAVLLPEHSITEQFAFAAKAASAGLQQVIFVHLEKDLEILTQHVGSDLVIYMQSADLRTGGSYDAKKARERLGELRQAVGDDTYVLVGFGIRGPAEITTLRETSADGAIIGTACVEAAGRGPEELGELIGTSLAATSKIAVGHAP